MFTVKEFKAQFFDRAVLDPADRAAKRALSKFGAFVRRTDKGSLKYRADKSAAGSPPSVHRGTTRFTRLVKKKGVATVQPASPERELIFFAWDARRKTVVIGPAVFSGSKIGGGRIPEVIEYGGPGAYLRFGKPAVGQYAARPHTNPAFRAELPKLPGMYREFFK